MGGLLETAVGQAGGAAAGGAATSGLMGTLGSFAKEQMMSNPLISGMADMAGGTSFSDAFANSLSKGLKQGDDEETKRRKAEMMEEGKSQTRNNTIANPYTVLVESPDWQQYINK